VLAAVHRLADGLRDGDGVGLGRGHKSDVVLGRTLGDGTGATMPPPGRLAQLGEHQLDKLGVTGSSPVPPTSRKPRIARG
jgi:hypothetical protein